ncbi:Fructokinase [Globisporangium polare]
MATSKRFAGVELGGTSWLLAIAVDDPQNIVEQCKIETTTPKETLDTAIAWLQTQKFDAIGIASFGPIDLNPSSPTYGYITSTPKPHWGNTEIVGVFQRAFPDTPIGFETDVNAPALYEVTHGGHGDISSACYITVGTGVGVGVALDGKAVHGFMHPEGGHVFVPPAEADREAGFNGVCPFHGACVEGMVGSPSIAARTGLDRRDVHTLTDDDPIWDTLAHYLAYLCMNLTLTVSPQVIVIGGGISKREKLFTLIREKFEKYLNNYVTYPAVEKYIRPSFHPDIGLVSSVELARLTLLKN